MPTTHIKDIFTYISRSPSNNNRFPIRLPNNPTRPVRLHKRDLLLDQIIHKDPWYFTVHRRGPRRLKVGDDPLEARAVPKSQIKGTLEERITYKWLQDRHVYFLFQSSLQGGRIQLGGLVADFILPDYMYVLNPAGPTHSEFGQHRKDEEQTEFLAEFGLRQWIIPQDTILNEAQFEEVMRRILGLGPGLGSSDGGTNAPQQGANETNPQIDQIGSQLDAMLTRVNNFLGASV